MSKTFKSAHPDNKALKVDELFGNPRLLIKEFNGDSRGFVYAPSDAPALALAILEAAGVTWNIDTALGRAAVELDKHVTTEAKLAAAAREQAELEQEALELYQLWETFQSDDETVWLAVARKAREMRAEK